GSLPLTLRAKMAVTAAAAIAVLVPFGFGIARGQSPRPAGLSVQASQSLPAFDVVSVRPFQRTRQPWNRGTRYNPQRLDIEGTAARGLIEEAYQVTSNQ